MESTIVIISHYQPHGLSNLKKLLKSIRGENFKESAKFDICVIVNSDDYFNEDDLLGISKFYNFKYFIRPNLGMNIGAWDYGWRLNASYKYALFLQDECYVVKDNWISAFIDQEIRYPGLVGESFNKKWNKDWAKIREENALVCMPNHYPALNFNRVDIYLNCIVNNSIYPTYKGGHLRSLIWFIRLRTLINFGGFIIGKNYGECIASEIAYSLKLKNLGLNVTQVNNIPFSYIKHSEWGIDRKILQ